LTTSIASTSRVRHKRWVIAPLAPNDHLKRFSDIAPLVVQVLYNHGITDPAEMAAFLQADRPTSTADVFRMVGMNRAVDRIPSCPQGPRTVAIYGDLRCRWRDGCTFGADAYRFWRERAPYIPRRADEGYGLNLKRCNT
jgi:hypothetical protein